ncbi:MAG: 16S rRNA (cytosine(1402)-N(4))-methyltransferase RsmH [Micavibrio aeruginosavorus]|uniref:Ribosomal RNA small subunit methyltransferase H n=1 Tax=Micavibrio aeruginosavorus TaxID=349221 RepID=A0A7T5UIY9_9BACT|nr:MAG: 16S rRNA (cytosine(1402)-N(4))-methyltransferase RsmH [Micavibrio aeruginosavorus]
MTLRAKTDETPHISVMLDEVLAALKPAKGEVYADGTFGAGGYSKAVLDSADCAVIGIDRDKSALWLGEDLKKIYEDRLILKHGRFSEIARLAAESGYPRIDGFMLDLGVSSMQIDQAERGFSFRFDGPLDMRMNQEGDEPSAADIVNTWDEEDLAHIIWKYGEERHSRRIARCIVEARKENPITRTGRLADIVRAAVPRSFADKIDPATRTFQALRIVVNAEMEELEQALAAAVSVLKPGGRLVVVSFHSLEDRIVKNFMQEQAGMTARSSRHLPDIPQQGDSSGAAFTLPSRKAVFPTDHELETNPRARSARLRVAVRTAEGGRG